uniref:Valine--tRNA ligase n=1 Tax=Hirondellea gigas TaxID=1518452 RepID=A0A6A7G606_9CRUS
MLSAYSRFIPQILKLSTKHTKFLHHSSTMPKRGKKNGEEKQVEESAYVDSTPTGQKKDMSIQMLPKYNPFQVESAWDSWWENRGFYKPSMESKDTFMMVIPPPNVTGELHIGHALMCTIEDCLTRWNRMCGKNTLWLPGLDHAGIATQTVVERKLQKLSGVSRHDLGREKFVEEVWKWRESYGGKICNQIRKLGSSVDWSREAFTMDKKLSRAVIEAFVRMHKKGKIYRATRLVNWSCHLSTAIADCEVDKEDLPGRRMITVPGHEHKVEFGIMHKFGYKFVDSDEQLLIETTRPETMLGDAAVAVHPDDKRYQHLIGEYLQHPFVDRRLKIIADPILVDMEKGTGVVKITPAHDHNDFECGERHNLEQINILTEDGRINENGGKYAGMMRFDCRFQILKDLQELGQYHGKTDNPQALGFCSRSNDVIESVLRPQWWVDCTEMAKRSTDAVRNGELKITPKREEKVFFHFMDNIRPWCISRQLWWGHRIPAYIPVIDGQKPLDPDIGDNWIIAATAEEAMTIACEKYETEEGKITLEQDEDVLDTWFSSGLFPFAVLGWPEKSKDLDTFYPGTLLETGGDILFFWVCRMVMMSLELNDILPFKEVLLHPMVRTADGSKMSKTKGNVINPLFVIRGAKLNDLIEQLKSSNIDDRSIQKYEKAKIRDFPNGIPACGADALRFGLLCYMSQGRSINLNVNVVIGYRQHCNKIWQAANFSLPKFSGCFDPPLSLDLKSLTSNESSASFADRWILSRLCETEQIVNVAMIEYDFSRATSALYDFWLKDFCDVYLELVKPLFPRGSEPQTKNDSPQRIAARNTLYLAFDRGLKLLHPFMPFITEELYQRLPGRQKDDSIMVQSYPKGINEWRNIDVENDMKIARKIAHSLRSSTMSLGIGNTVIPSVLILCSSDSKSSTISPLCGEIATMSNCEQIILLQNANDPRLRDCLKTVVDAEIEVHIVLKGLVDFQAQLKKLAKQHSKIEGSIKSLKAKLDNPKYLEKVPVSVQEADREKYESRKEESIKLLESIQQLESLQLKSQNS